MPIPTTIRIDIDGQRDIQPGITLSNGDANAYGFVLEFYNNGAALDITGYNIAVYGRRSGSTTVIPDTGTVQYGKGYYVIKQSMYAYAGETLIEIALTDAEGMSLTTKVMHFPVRGGFSASGGAVVNEQDYAVLSSLITAAQAAQQQAVAAAEYATTMGDTITGQVGAHKAEAVLDHPDGSVTDAKIGTRSVGAITNTLLGWLEWIVSLFAGTGGHAHTGEDGDGTKIATDGIADESVTSEKLDSGIEAIKVIDLGTVVSTDGIYDSYEAGGVYKMKWDYGYTPRSEDMLIVRSGDSNLRQFLINETGVLTRVKLMGEDWPDWESVLTSEKINEANGIAGLTSDSEIHENFLPRKNIIPFESVEVDSIDEHMEPGQYHIEINNFFDPPISYFLFVSLTGVAALDDPTNRGVRQVVFGGEGDYRYQTRKYIPASGGAGGWSNWESPFN